MPEQQPEFYDDEGQLLEEREDYFSVWGVTDAAWDGLGEFDKPFLTIWASNDPGNLGRTETQQALLDHIPGTEGWDYVRLPEASHFLQDDQGEEIARRINEFITATSQD